MRFLVAALLCIHSVLAQDKYPKDYFRSPMDIPLSLAGSFGELRPNHFHSGLDFRTEKREGIPIYASADGFVSRIKIATGGYGKSIYIDHPNGFTTVYAHLQSYSPSLQKMMNEQQYARKSFEIELYPKPDEFPIKKGELIAYSGNTGSSGGPHLHFEFRDTKTEKIINPLFFGFDAKIKDTKAPQVTGLLAYPIGDSSQVNNSSRPVFISLSLQSDGSYLAEQVAACGKLAFGINAYDTSDFNYGKNGIFEIDTFLNGLPYFGFEFETFSFDETKYVNTFIDYPRYQAQKQRYQKLFVGAHYANSIMKETKNDGIISVFSNFSLTYKIVVRDFNGNSTVINVPISYAKLPVIQKEKTMKPGYFLKSRIDNSYAKDGISVFIPAYTFEEDFFLDFDVKDNELFLHDDSVAVLENMTITFDVSKIPEAERAKMFIANLDDGKATYRTTYKKDSLFSIKTKSLGKFFLMKDTVAPKIYQASFKEGDTLDKQKTLKVSIYDDLSGIKEYNAYLNGKWILMEYETKTHRLTHNFSDAVFDDGRNDFKIIVTDNLGNSTTFESYFFKTK
ncbi:M23 family metallopeptidase [Flavobacterium humi]|uniref:M23 family metallopeptidase n=1 Tax=Flavobacterium humi TaxID=2562683 RepID=A0A4Z0L2U2_9FLAO|nr:M23 family metallopeptidase [Flavobacterium humi]TGD56753.1 M23 family metallopeptidase [Flavobacterium humi]